jgi:hypothetical protein
MRRVQREHMLHLLTQRMQIGISTSHGYLLSPFLALAAVVLPNRKTREDGTLLHNTKLSKA